MADRHAGSRTVRPRRSLGTLLRAGRRSGGVGDLHDPHYRRQRYRDADPSPDTGHLGADGVRPLARDRGGSAWTVPAGSQDMPACPVRHQEAATHRNAGDVGASDVVGPPSGPSADRVGARGAARAAPDRPPPAGASDDWPGGMHPLAAPNHLARISGTARRRINAGGLRALILVVERGAPTAGGIAGSARPRSARLSDPRDKNPPRPSIPRSSRGAPGPRSHGDGARRRPPRQDPPGAAPTWVNLARDLLQRPVTSNRLQGDLPLTGKPPALAHSSVRRWNTRPVRFSGATSATRCALPSRRCIHSLPWPVDASPSRRR